MQLETVLRAGRADDAESLTALSIQVWLDTYAMEGVRPSIAQYVLTEFAPARFRQRLADPDVEVAIADVNGSIVGFSVVRHGAICPGRPEVTSEVEVLYVQPRFARAGVGSRLLSHCGRLVRKRTKSPYVWLSVNAHNEPALAFYRKHGCKQVGSIAFELDGARHENIVLTVRGELL
jgi:diamine N-acetyltransferase